MAAITSFAVRCLLVLAVDLLTGAVPGEKYSYSNTGYMLLGLLIERITGEYYQTFLQENFFQPLGMSDTGYDSNLLVIPHRAVGFEYAGMLLHAGYDDMNIPFSVGGLYSTTHDLLRWNKALYGGSVLSAAELKKLTTPYKENYACGLGVYADHGHTVYEHSGHIDGFTADMAYYPDEKLTIIALGNLGMNTAGEMVTALAEVAHRQKVALATERKEISVGR